VRFAAARLLVAVSLGIIVLAVLNWLLGGQVFWRSTLFYAMVGSVAVLLTGWWWGHSGHLGLRRRVLVLGAGGRAERLRELAERPESGFVIVGFA
jgi:ABC-type sugar transport system permease subunit